MGSPTARALELLKLAHASPGLTRSRAAVQLGVTSGTITELVSSLVGARLLDERPVPTGGRGRPTRELLAHAEGPLVLSAVVTHEAWRIRAEELGGAVVAGHEGAHDGSEHLIADLAAATADLAGRYGPRVRGVGVALPGVVRNDRLVHAPLLGWRDIDMRRVWPGGLVLPGNDATLAALGEARRGAAVGAGLHVHLLLDAGIGGAVTLDGVILPGAQGVGGEFGHMPFGDRAVRCHCGASGCWTTSVGAEGLARTLGETLPQDAVTYARQVLDRARHGETAARRAVASAAACLGGGIAGLVNGLDVGLVTVGGLAPLVVEVAAEEFTGAYTDGLMAFRRADPPVVRDAALGDEAPLTGAAEQVWSRVWATL
ncbi:ROK family protein [Actinoplanes sp. NBRC 103695]|uniref:ROK family protein n=1 Tax=Actinoplanes sp. NBRC 103695 TaxID=3032202 RepID=UPI0024A29BFD|nr:ROK family protein [Actinoplanes sp. NBRC 103695]GLY92864.1 xylose repressor [Actinoplanes sp. NBRC 103695]